LLAGALAFETDGFGSRAVDRFGEVNDWISAGC
jgi:hypothetical protein